MPEGESPRGGVISAHPLWTVLPARRVRPAARGIASGGTSSNLSRRRGGADNRPSWGRVVKKILILALVAFSIFFVAYRPASAASVARWMGSTLAGVAVGFGEFFSRLVT